MLAIEETSGKEHLAMIIIFLTTTVLIAFGGVLALFRIWNS
jgi:hypothetical protein